MPQDYTEGFLYPYYGYSWSDPDTIESLSLVCIPTLPWRYSSSPANYDFIDRWTLISALRFFWMVRRVRFRVSCECNWRTSTSPIGIDEVVEIFAPTYPDDSPYDRLISSANMEAHYALTGFSTNCSYQFDNSRLRRLFREAGLWRSTDPNNDTHYWVGCQSNRSSSSPPLTRTLQVSSLYTGMLAIEIGSMTDPTGGTLNNRYNASRFVSKNSVSIPIYAVTSAESANPGRVVSVSTGPDYAEWTITNPSRVTALVNPYATARVTLEDVELYTPSSP